MDDQLLQKYFRNQCTSEEIGQVLNWFGTPAGEAYLEEKLDEDTGHYADEDMPFLLPDVPSVEMLRNIQVKRRRWDRRKRRHNLWMRVAVVLLVCATLAGSGYWLLHDYGIRTEKEITHRTISTTGDQHRLARLSDGTKVRLNIHSSLEIPESFVSGSRSVRLSGEAYFKVARDEDRPFTIRANGTKIRVLGTEFNVKVDSATQSVQVAVVSGKVSLRGEDDSGGTGAILTKDNFGVYDLVSGEILIEKSPVQNYLSWISGRLHFYDEPLWVVSRYLGRLYDTELRFEDEELKSYPLSTDMAKRELTSVLDIIAQTLGIGYRYENGVVLWTKNDRRQTDLPY